MISLEQLDVRLQKHWVAVPIPEVAFLQEGPGLRNWQWTDSGMKVINGTNILPNGEIDTTNTSRFISIEDFESKYRHFEVQSGDVVVSSSGSCGKVGRISDRDLPLMMNTSVVRFHPRAGAPLDANYLFAFLRSPIFRAQVDVFVTGSAQPNFGPSHIREMVLLLPPLPTQRKIAAILSAHDDLIENNLRRIRILEEMARSLYREWFVEFRFPGHERVRLVQSPHGTLPEGWKGSTIGALAEDVRRGVSPTEVPPDTPYIGLEHLPRRSITLCDWGLASEVASTKLEFRKGEILFGKIRPYFHKVGVAPVDGVCSSDAIVLRVLDGDLHALVTLVASSDEFVAYATRTSQGTKMPRADWKVLRMFPVAVPPKALLDQFRAVFDPALGLMQNLMFRNRALRVTRDLLLPRLISGELDVSDLDIAVPEAAA